MDRLLHYYLQKLLPAARLARPVPALPLPPPLAHAPGETGGVAALK